MEIKKKKKKFTIVNDQILNFIHGGPGTGKTFLIIRCLEKLAILNYQNFFINNNLLNKSDASKVYATTGIAGANYIIYSGSTVNSGLSIPIMEKSRGSKSGNRYEDDIG